MGRSGVEIRRWTRREYDRLVELGALGPGDRVELLAGRMIVAEPQDSPHATGVRLAQQALERAFGPGWDVRTQLPLALDRVSEPEPDVAVVPGGPRDYARGHPSSAVLVVEVADWSLALDRGPKARRYARAGIADYWIVNLRDRVLEVHRAPGREGRRWRYRSVDILDASGSIAPLAAPAAAIAAGDLLP
jgi:Uma2 family endonuclease